MTLEEIAAKHPTDKLGTHSYLPIYERLFAPLKRRRGTVLEVGVDGGGSLCIWREWFSDAEIIGMDINVKPPYIEGVSRISHIQRDAYCDYGRLQSNVPDVLIAIDDGPHSIESQRYFCSHYPLLLTPDGMAVVEDIQNFEQDPGLDTHLPNGFNSCYIDLRHVKGRYDDVLFVAWRK